MHGLDYTDARAPIRDDLVDAHRFLARHFTSPGTWWTGAERAAIAAASRAASRCRLCRARKADLSPHTRSGRHDGDGALPELVVDTVHRIRTDSARLSRGWFEQVAAAGLQETRYVELVAVTALGAGIDYFARAAGIPPLTLPPSVAGDPFCRRPWGAKPGIAWVPMIAPEDASGDEAGLYGSGQFIPNIMRALSLVPAEVRALRLTSAAHYVPTEHIPDPTWRRALDRPQIELVAARVSALNGCFY